MEVQFRTSASELYRHYMTLVHSQLRKQLEQSIEDMRKYYYKKPKIIEPFNKGNLIMLSGKNIRTKHRCKKLDDKMYPRI